MVLKAIEGESCMMVDGRKRNTTPPIINSARFSTVNASPSKNNPRVTLTRPHWTDAESGFSRLLWHLAQLGILIGLRDHIRLISDLRPRASPFFMGGIWPINKNYVTGRAGSAFPVKLWTAFTLRVSHTFQSSPVSDDARSLNQDGKAIYRCLVPGSRLRECPNRW